MKESINNKIQVFIINNVDFGLDISDNISERHELVNYLHSLIKFIQWESKSNLDIVRE